MVRRCNARLLAKRFHFSSGPVVFSNRSPVSNPLRRRWQRPARWRRGLAAKMLFDVGNDPAPHPVAERVERFVRLVVPSTGDSISRKHRCQARRRAEDGSLPVPSRPRFLCDQPNPAEPGRAAPRNRLIRNVSTKSFAWWPGKSCDTGGGARPARKLITRHAAGALNGMFGPARQLHTSIGPARIPPEPRGETPDPQHPLCSRDRATDQDGKPVAGIELREPMQQRHRVAATGLADEITARRRIVRDDVRIEGEFFRQRGLHGVKQATRAERRQAIKERRFTNRRQLGRRCVNRRS